MPPFRTGGGCGPNGQEPRRYEDRHRELGKAERLNGWRPHAFIVKSATAKVIGIQPTCECETFYRGASEPFDGSACVVDFARIALSA